VAIGLAKAIGVGTVTLSRLTYKVARATGTAAGDAYETSQPVLGKLAEWVALGGRKAGSAFLMVARWALSAKDDVLSEGDHDVNPVSLIAKLLTIVLSLFLVAVLVINIARWVGVL
jgi:hypothetical protein